MVLTAKLQRKEGPSISYLLAEGSELEVNYFHSVHPVVPVTVTERSRARTVLARSEAGIVGLSPTQGMDVLYVYMFILCLGRGLATSSSLVQGVLPSVK
jgi:hypothetical protein